MTKLPQIKPKYVIKKLLRSGLKLERVISH
jgi:predicted RNA binding protein YcfA (HicA-like mRNA interferase family)